MAGEAQDSSWPLPRFSFRVKLGGDEAAFQEISGLQVESARIEYRHGDSKDWSPIKMSGMQRVGNVTLKKGIFVNDTKLFDWFTEVKMNAMKRQTVVISLLDERGIATVTWTLHKAYPTKVSAAEFNSSGNEVAVESIDLAFETLEITS